MTDETLLHRQIHPAFVQEGRWTSQAFKPTPKDENRLSVYDGDQIGPPEAWEHYTEELQLESAGVVSVSCQDCSTEQLPVEADPAPFPEHAVIVFNGFSSTEITKKAKKLKSAAEQRGWQYEPAQ